MSRPRKLIRPSSASTIRMTVWAVVVLPQPDSPTSASISPGPTLKSTPSTAWTCSCFWRLSVANRLRGTG